MKNRFHIAYVRRRPASVMQHLLSVFPIDIQKRTRSAKHGCYSNAHAATILHNNYCNHGNIIQKVSNRRYWKPAQLLSLKQACRPWVCRVCHGTPNFGRSVNPISIRGERLCPPNYYWHTRIFRLSDSPAQPLLRHLVLRNVYVR